MALSLPPVPQPLPPTLAEGGTNYLTIQWQQSPRCQCYFLDMALSNTGGGVKEGGSPRGPRGGDAERAVVGGMLDWTPVYSGKDYKCLVTGLKPGQSYWFRVRYVPAVTPPLAPPTPPPPSMPAFFWTHCSPPNAPNPPQLAARGRSTLKVKWAPPSETGGKPITLYQLRMRPPPARGDDGASWQADWEGFVEIYQGLETSYKVARLVPGRDYAFRLRAFNCMGGGGFCREAVFSTQPSVPGQPAPPRVVAQTSSSVTLQWTAPHGGGTNITEYVLEIDDGDGGQFAQVYQGPEMICEVQALHAGFTYRCRVLAVNEIGRGAFSVPVDFETGRSEPFKPPPPTLSSRGPNSLTLAWDPPKFDGGSEVSHYRVEVWYPKWGAWDSVYDGPGRACSVNNLQPGLQYRVRVLAVNEIGLSEPSEELRIATNAAAPQSMDPPELGDSHSSALLLRWAPPKHDGGAKVAGYRLEMQGTEEGGSVSGGGGRGKVVYSGLEESAWVKGLQPGCEYTFRMQSYNKLGNSAWSIPVNFQTLPSAPSVPGPPTLAPSAATTATSSQLPLVWDAPAANGDPIASYCLQMCVASAQNSEKWADSSPRESRTSSPLGGRPIPDSSCSGDLTESFTFPKPSELNAKPGGFIKPAPSDETTSVASVDDETLLDHSSDKGNDVSGVMVKDDNLVPLGKGLVNRTGGWSDREDLPFEDACVSGIPGATVAGLLPHTLYAFRVRAINSVGSSDYSAVSYLVTASAEPAAPPPLTVVGTGPDHVHLRWEKPARDNGEPVDSYTLEIERRSSHRSAGPSNAIPGPRSAKSRSARVVGIGGSTAAALAAVSKEEETWEEVYNGSGRECLVDSLDPGRPYRFRVRAWNAIGGSSPSSSLQVHTDAAPPLAPSPPLFSAATSSSVRVRWSPPEEDNGAIVRSYKLGMDDGLGGAFRQVYEGSALKHAATKLVPGRTYLFRVQAISEVGASPPSAPSSVSLPRAPPRAPQTPYSKHVSTSAIALAWDVLESDGEEERFASRTGFTLQIADRGGFSTVYEGEEASFTVRDLTPGASYRFRVRSNGPADVEPGTWSPTTTIATEAAAKAARPTADKRPSQLNSHLSRQIKEVHRVAARWQGLPARRATAVLCLLFVVISALVQWFL